MKILSVNVGKPKPYTLDGVQIDTSMVKESSHQIQVNLTSIDGDEFQSGHIHGIPDAVVYAMNSQHYDYWQKFCGRTLNFGTLGENLSVAGLDESEVFIGDEFQCGPVVIQATGVRYPCTRLNYVTGLKTMRDEFLKEDRCGIYFSVLTPGTIRPNDTMILKKRYQTNLTTLDLYQALRACEKKTITDDQFNKLVDSPFLIERHKNRLYRLTGKAKSE